MKRYIAFLFLALALIARAADPATGDFTGHYELVKHTKSAFTLDILQKDKGATISFSGGNADGSGAAPDGDGEGKLNAKGELEFKWTDTFDNAGTATLRRSGKQYHLSINAVKVTDPRALSFYGEVTLKLISRKPQMSTR